MTFKEFKKAFKIYKQTNESFRELDDLGFIFLENKKFPIWDNFDKLLMLTFESHYHPFGMDWITWFIYENDCGKGGLSANDNGPICYDLKSLYEYIDQYKKIKQYEHTI